MKIITWNCNMAYRKKADFILAHKPDTLIIPECEKPEKIKFDTHISVPTNVLWYGDNQNKGLAIFSFGSYKLQELDIYNPAFKMIVPVMVSSESSEFILFAVWAYNPQDPSYKYIGQVWKAILYYENILKDGRVIIAGDFNSNVIWDKLKRKISHTMVVEKLRSLNIFSTYHANVKLEQGVEHHPTFYLYRHKHRPYHIDYCFASEDMISKVQSVEVGTHEQWVLYSDHCPLFVTFEL